SLALSFPVDALLSRRPHQQHAGTAVFPSSVPKGDWPWRAARAGPRPDVYGYPRRRFLGGLDGRPLGGRGPRSRPCFCALRARPATERATALRRALMDHRVRRRNICSSP
ncbi:unnamed protein product, partial [Ixodes persulcatus]